MITAYPDVDLVLRALVSGAQAILGSRLVGFYLDGSLAIGDFDEASSDIDFVGVLTEEMPSEVFVRLQNAARASCARAHALGARAGGLVYPTRGAGGPRSVAGGAPIHRSRK